MIRRRNFDIVLLVYAVTLMSMLLFLYRTNAVLNNVRYLYVVFMITITLMQGVIYKNKQVLNVIGAFLIHTILFGFLIIPATASFTIIFDNGKELLILWTFVFTTSQYIYKNHLEKEFLLISQCCVSLFMDFCYLRHFNGIAPLKFFGGIFGVGNRVRFTFGLSAANRTAYLAVASIILILFVLKERCWIRIGNRFDVYKFFLKGSLVIAVLIILSTQTRGAIIAIIAFICINVFLNSKWLSKFRGTHMSKRIRLRMSILIAIFYGGYAYYVFVVSGARSEFINQSWNAYKELSNQWIGLGYVPFSAFLTDSMGWGTTALDCYYVYIICTTGIIGAIIIFAILIYLLGCLFKAYFGGYSNSLGNASIALYLVLLFIGFSETMVVGPWIPHNYVYWILFMLVLMNSKNAQHRKEIVEAIQ